MKVEYKNFSSRRKFGVEMEVNHAIPADSLVAAIKVAGLPSHTVPWGYSIQNKVWEIKPDSTCGDTGKKSDGGGFEAISPPDKGVNHLMKIESVATALQKCGAKVNSHCGLHCHVDIHDHSTTHASTLAAHWCKIEKIITNILPEHRLTKAGAKYCKMFTKKYTINRKAYTATEFWQKIKPSTLGPPGKRTAISFINYLRSRSDDYQWEMFSSRSTVELRIPEGTIEPEEVKNWVRMFVNFVDTCYGREFPVDLKSVGLREGLYILGLDSNSDSYCLLLSQGLLDTKVWLLNRILRYSKSSIIKSEARRIMASMIVEDVY